MAELPIILASTAFFGWGAAGWVRAWHWRRAYLNAIELRDLIGGGR